jgi:hypothetical protein
MFWDRYNPRPQMSQRNVPAPSPQPMTYGAPPLTRPQGPGMIPPQPQPGNFGRPLGGAGATPASPNYGRAPAAPMSPGQQMLARGRGDVMPRTTAPSAPSLPNPQRAAGSGAGPQVMSVGGKTFYR